MRATIIFAISCVLVGCSYASHRSEQRPRSSQIALPFDQTDVPDEGRIYLNITNPTKYNICVNGDKIPSNGSFIGTGKIFDDVFLLINEMKYNYFDQNIDYCPNCWEIIRPFEKTKRFINYTHFSIPNKLNGAKKKLNMKIIGKRCTRDEVMWKRKYT